MEYANTEKTTDADNCASIFARVAEACIDGTQNPKMMSPLALAYVGDTVYDLYVRTMLVSTTTLPAHGLHVRAAKLVCAKAQAEAYRRIESLLTEEESAIFKRGRNAHMGTVPKNAQILDYRHATGLESLIGYLYLSGKDERLGCLMNRMLCGLEAYSDEKSGDDETENNKMNFEE